MAGSSPSMSTATAIPLVDLAPWFGGGAGERDAVAASLDHAFATAGFAVIVGHGVDPTLGPALRAEARWFFAGDEAEKDQVRADALGRPGWIPPGVEANGYVMGVETPPDLKESLSFFPGHLPDRAAFVPPNRWPVGRPGLRDAAEAWITAADALYLELLRIAARAVGLAEGTFADASTNAANNLYVNWYPPVSHVGEPLPGQFRIGPHADFGVLTLLDREPGAGGLQVLAPGADPDTGWIDAPFVPGALTVNVGDLLALWSGGRWHSATHRVLPPPLHAPDESLVSLIYFAEGDADALIVPISGDAEPVLAGEFLQQKLAEISVAVS